MQHVYPKLSTVKILRDEPHISVFFGGEFLFDGNPMASFELMTWLAFNL